MFKKMSRWLVVCVFILPWLSYAYFPVIDVHAILSMSKQLTQLKKDYETLNALKDVSTKGFANIASELSGQYGYGNLNNDWSSVQSRYQSNGDWESWLSTDAPVNVSLASWSTQYTNTHPLWSSQSWLKSVPNSDRTERKSTLSESRAASIEASYAYDQFDQRQQLVHDLSQHIDQTENTKAAIDLNSRLSVESQYVQNEQLKQVAILNKQLAEARYQRLSAMSKEDSFTDLEDDEEESLDDGDEG